MNENVEIIYIKNGIEKKISFKQKRKMNSESKLKNIFLRNINANLGVSYEVRKDVVFIHIKNYIFNRNTKIRGSGFRKKMLILEDCTFEKDGLEIEWIDNLEIINPKFMEDSSIYIFNSKDAIVTLGDCKSEVGIFVEDVKKFNLNSSDYLSGITLENVDDVHLKNVKSYIRAIYNGFSYEMNILLEDCFLSDDLYLESGNIYNLKLRNSKIEESNDEDSYYYGIESLDLENSSVNASSKLNFWDLTILCLRESHIKANDSIVFKNLEKIVFNDDMEDTILDTHSYLEVGKSIKLNDQVFKKYRKDINLIIDEKGLKEDLNLKRQVLKFVLEAYKIVLEKSIENKVSDLEKRQEKELKLIKKKNKKERIQYKEKLLSKKINEL